MNSALTIAGETLDSRQFPKLDEAALVRWAQASAAIFSSGGVIYLVGDLGAGKTTLARALIQALGYSDRVKSPTYSLLEEYALPELNVCHLDLYRLGSPADVVDLGLEDLGAGRRCLYIVEWAEKGLPYLPPPDLVVTLGLCTLQDGTSGRHMDCRAFSAHACAWLQAWPQHKL